MVSSFVIAEGVQRTPEGYESCLSPLGRWLPTPYRRPMRAEWPDVLYGDWPSRPSSQWVALASAEAGTSDLPAPVRIRH